MPQVTFVEPFFAAMVAVAPSPTVTLHASTAVHVMSQVAFAAQEQSAAHVKVPLVVAVGTVGTTVALHAATAMETSTESRLFFIPQG